ncbi:MAG: hypothetical protein ACM3PP_14075 [Candidatus Saccharibacteria bacterium]
MSKKRRNPKHHEDDELDMFPWKLSHLDFLWPFCRIIAGRKPRT